MYIITPGMPSGAVRRETRAAEMSPPNKDLPTILRSSVPLLKGFSPEEIQTILSICSLRTCKEGDVLIETGTPSTEMFLILTGEVLVRTENGVPLARLAKPETVGEMGIFTGEPRSATVEVTQGGSCVVIARSELLRVLSKSPAMAIRMYKNVVEILSSRLRNENLHTQMYGDRMREMERLIPPAALQAGAEVHAAEGGDAEAEMVIEEFYKSIGASGPSIEKRAHDLRTYKFLLDHGYSVDQIRKAGAWTAKNIRGVKEFMMIRYTIGKSLRET